MQLMVSGNTEFLVSIYFSNTVGTIMSKINKNYSSIPSFLKDLYHYYLYLKTPPVEEV